MIAGNYNFICEQGATFNRNILWESNSVPTNLTGYTARMQVRSDYSSSTIIKQLTTENGGIILGGAAGTIDLLIPASETTLLTAGIYIYDLELVFNSTVYRLIQGKFTVNPEVTK